MCDPVSALIGVLGGSLGGRSHKPGRVAPDPQVVVDQQASIAAADAAAAWRQRRIRSSLQAGSNGVIGSPSVLGAAASGPGGGGGGRAGVPSRASSLMGAHY